MSLAVLRSRALCGVSASLVTVEVHLANGLPAFTIVGLPETEVKESKDRVRAALQNARFEFPARRITVNLAPADLPKESGRFDLPIALGILAASGQIPADQLSQYEFAGELSLSGELRPIRGALAMTFAMRPTEADPTPRSFILPRANAEEAALVHGVHIFPADTLLEVCAHFSAAHDARRLSRHVAQPTTQRPPYPDFNEVKGQSQAKRALEIAAAGGHSVLMIGPPGTGKSMLASRLPGILPTMTDEEALESAAVHSLTNGFSISKWKHRPFRSPHHTASGVALVGGGGVKRNIIWQTQQYVAKHKITCQRHELHSHRELLPATPIPHRGIGAVRSYLHERNLTRSRQRVPRTKSKRTRPRSEASGLDTSSPGKPQQNAYVERFSRTVVNEWLSRYLWGFTWIKLFEPFADAWGG